MSSSSSDSETANNFRLVARNKPVEKKIVSTPTDSDATISEGCFNSSVNNNHLGDDEVTSSASTKARILLSSRPGLLFQKVNQQQGWKGEVSEVVERPHKARKRKTREDCRVIDRSEVKRDLSWLPDSWIIEENVRPSGAKDRFYWDTKEGVRCRSKNEVLVRNEIRIGSWKWLRSGQCHSLKGYFECLQPLRVQKRNTHS